jgi:hypothetical protein
MGNSPCEEHRQNDYQGVNAFDGRYEVAVNSGKWRNWTVVVDTYRTESNGQDDWLTLADRGGNHHKFNLTGMLKS